jgi:hypothetical protein
VIGYQRPSSLTKVSRPFCSTEHSATCPNEIVGRAPETFLLFKLDDRATLGWACPACELLSDNELARRLDAILRVYELTRSGS